MTGWPQFHAEFASKFGFPGYYGRNMNAWIDCMSYLDDEASDSTFALARGDTLSLVIPDCEARSSAHPDLFRALTDCIASVNRRFVEAGGGTQIVVKPL